MRELGISEKRREHVLQNILDSFEYHAISRRIVRIKLEDFTDNFSRLGLNLIVDKVWFVDLHEGETFYAYQTIGKAEGKAIALSETEMVIKSILTRGNTKENLIRYSGELDEKNLQPAISLLEKRTFDCSAILANFEDVMLFWLESFKSFKGCDKSKSPFGLEGFYNEIPVYWSTFIPKGMTLVLNKDVGELSIKKDITADIREIREEELESIKKTVPDLTVEDSKEKVRLTADETVSFKFNNEECVIILTSS